MPEVPINYLAVLVGAISNMVIGALWWGPIFGKFWTKEMGWTKETMDAMKAKGGMAKSYALMFVGALVMSFVLAHALVFASQFLEIDGVQAGLMAGFFNWLGFIAPVTLGSVLWEGKSWKLWVLNNAYSLLSLCVMGVILAMWQ